MLAGTKQCTLCGENKPASAFRRYDGYSRNQCHLCRKRAWKRQPISRDVGAARQFILKRIIETDCGYASPCWLWQLSLNPRGYARGEVTGYSRRSVKVHRAAFEVFVGQIENGLEIDHLCRVTACVNPSHLEPVTPTENKRRQAKARQRKMAATRGILRGEGCNGQRPTVTHTHTRLSHLGGEVF